MAESTGKDDRGIVPVAGEPLGSPAVYGQDRVFVHIRAAGDEDKEQEACLNRLEAVGHPVIRIEAADLLDLGQEFFRWEVAVGAPGGGVWIQPVKKTGGERGQDPGRESEGGAGSGP